ncbi:MAG: ankyrin repeat domain-containing protein [Alphaproteobacteria bacterium]
MVFFSKKQKQLSPEEETLAQWQAHDLQVLPTTAELNKRLQDSLKANFLVVAEEALRKGAHPEIPSTQRLYDYNPPLLMYATRNADEPVIRLLLQYGANPDSEEYSQGITPLNEAIQMGNSRIVRMLLDAGARLDQRDMRSTWAVSGAEIARKKFFTDIVKMLEEEPARRREVQQQAARKAAEEVAAKAEKEAELQRQAEEMLANPAATTAPITVGKPLTLKTAKRPSGLGAIFRR